MKLKILASTAQTDSTRLIQKAAQSLGFNFEVLLLDQIQTSPEGISHQNVQVLSDAETLIWPRLGTLSRDRGLQICERFEAFGFRLLNSSAAMRLASDKILSLKALNSAGVPTPQSWFFSPEERLKLADLCMGETPEKIKFWIKTRIGSQGIGVSWAYDAVQALAQMDIVRVSAGAGLIQEHTPGGDLRVLVNSGHVIGAMSRQSSGGDPRSNLHQGATASPSALSSEEQNLALKSMKALGLCLGGVDLIRSPMGPKVVEVNPSPGLAGISSCLAMNAAIEILGNHSSSSSQ